MYPSLTATFRRTRICVLTSTLTAATPAYPKNTDIPTSQTAKNPCKTRMTFEQKSSPRQRQHAPLRIAESLARFIALLTAQALSALKIRRARTQTAIPRECLLGGRALCAQADKRTLIQGILILILCPFADGTRAARRRVIAQTALRQSQSPTSSFRA